MYLARVNIIGKRKNEFGEPKIQNLKRDASEEEIYERAKEGFQNNTEHITAKGYVENMEVVEDHIVSI